MKKIILLSTGLALIAAACVVLGSCDDSESGGGDSFDRGVLLQDMAGNIIKPQYTTLQTQVNALKTATDAFTNDVSEPNLAALQTAWANAYRAWQYTNAFNFGPAGEERLRRRLVEEVALFPVDETQIETNIEANNTALDDAHRDARGFLAVEYLIFRLDEDNGAVLAAFEAANRKGYLTAVVSKLKSQIDDVVAAWNGSYAADFVSNNGKAAGSSTSELCNEFIRSFEAVKNFKVALPLGIAAGQTATAPQLVEAYYSGLSIEMMKANIVALENIWYGRAVEGGDGTGLKEYLESVTGGADLIAATEAQMANVKAALAVVDTGERLSLQVDTNFDNVNAFHTELQKHTRYYKSDMMSLLGISITFDSGDGD